MNLSTMKRDLLNKLAPSLSFQECSCRVTTTASVHFVQYELPVIIRVLFTRWIMDGTKTIYYFAIVSVTINQWIWHFILQCVLLITNSILIQKFFYHIFEDYIRICRRKELFLSIFRYIFFHFINELKSRRWTKLHLVNTSKL